MRECFGLPCLAGVSDEDGLIGGGCMQCACGLGLLFSTAAGLAPAPEAEQQPREEDAARIKQAVCGRRKHGAGR